MEREGSPLNPPKGDFANAQTLAFRRYFLNLCHPFDGGFLFRKIA
jgi:hypothetical protein